MKTKSISTVLTALALTANAFATEAKPAIQPPAAPQPFVRISSIDGVMNLNHKSAILRTPGKKISFSADLFVRENGKMVPQHASAQDFLWKISTNLRTCDPARAEATCKPTDIEVSQNGISFKIFAGSYGIVNETMESMTVTAVYAKDKSLTDKITIKNKDLPPPPSAEELRKLDEATADAEDEAASYGSYSNSEPSYYGDGYVQGGYAYHHHDGRFDNHRYGYGRNYDEPRPVPPAPIPSPGYGGRDWRRSDEGGRFGRGFDRHDEARPVPPAPIPSAPPPGFSGRGERHDGGFRSSTPVIQPPAPRPQAVDAQQPAVQAAERVRQQAAEAEQAAAQAAMLERIKALQAKPANAAPPSALPGLPNGSKAFGR